MSFEKQDEMAQKILTEHRGKVLAIVKATRSGATTSLLKRAIELGQKTVIIAPYIKIFDLTVNDVKNIATKGNEARIARISANKDICEKVKAKIRKHPNLKDLAFHLRPSCKDCEFNDPKRCELQEILHNDYDILGLTYAKLKTVCTSESKIDSEILKKLKQADNLILDEFTSGAISTAPSVPIVEPYAYLDAEFDLFADKPLERISEVEAFFREKIPEFVIYSNSVAGRLKDGGHEFFENPLSEENRDYFDEHFAECWKVIEMLTIAGRDTRLLQEIFKIISAKAFLISMKEGNAKVSPVEDLTDRSIRGSRYLADFVQSFPSEGKLTAIVDACLPDLDMKEILGMTVEDYFWGDPLETSSSQLIICDTRQIGVKAFFSNLKTQTKLKTLIEFACHMHKPEAILIVTLNKKMASAVIAWKKKDEIPSVDVTWYRSAFSRGITIDPKHRILILIGGPYLPNLAYLAEAYKTDKLNALKNSDMKSAFINLIGRVKDPKGEEKSVVYATGITAKEVRAFVTQKNIPSPLVFKFLTTGADAADFELAAHLFLHATELRNEWKNLEEDLPVLERILRICRLRDKSLTLGEIFPKGAEKVQQFIESYPDVLEKFSIEILKSPRGYRLTPRGA